MFGHGLPFAEPGGLPFGGPPFCAGGVVGAVEVDGVLVVLAAAVLAAVVLCVVVAPAFAMPAAAPPVASAPATMVAPSSLEMVIGSSLLGSIGVGVMTIVGEVAKSQCRRA
jgi:hypothetical protein